MNLARLLQLASPTLPVGAYSYSGGLEAAVEARIVTDAASAERWISDVLEFSLGRFEIPIAGKMMTEPGALESLNELLLASRETAELRAETVQMGYSLARLIKDLENVDVPLDEPSFPAAYAFIALRWEIEPEAALQAYVWAWIENQVMAAVKAVPLGQTDGQRMLLSLSSHVEKAFEMQELGNCTPGLAMLSAKHETQYSRLFRS